MMNKIVRLLLAFLMLTGSARSSMAQVKPPAADLTRATLEDLMNIEITSASRKEQRVDDVAGAIYVITHDEIRRSGMTTVPDLLRLVPGVQVAQINANKWAVSVRGFNGLYSNKLLVLVDGRSVYNRLFSGVLWDAEDLMLEDVDRIEVIRGPGAAVWGANAVNGVINILTKPASETTGPLARVSGGTSDAGQAAVRYGGAIGDARYRVYSQWSAHGNSLNAPHAVADDSLRSATVGFRSDWSAGPSAFTLEGNGTRASAVAGWRNLDPVRTAGSPATIETATDMTGATMLGRWTRARQNGASLQVQSFVDVAHRDEPVGEYHRRTADFDAQYHTAIGGRHDVVAGAGYRVMSERFAGRMGYSLTPEQSTDKLFNVFAQDEIAMAPNRLHATVGAKVEHDDLAGWGLQPTARLMWDVVPQRQHLWAAASRALKTPSLQDRGIRVDYPPDPTLGPLPVLVSLFGSPDTRAEEFLDAEMGYRLDINTYATIAVTGYFGRYDNLRTNEALAPSVVFTSLGPYVSAPVHFENLLEADTRGLEISAHWTPLSLWRLDAGYTAFHLTPRIDPASHDPVAATYDGDAPGQQWHVHSGFSIGRRVEVDGSVFHVGALRGLGVPAYTRADARLEWKLARALSLVGAGQNLLNRSHAEFSGRDANLFSTTVPRSIRLQLTWRVS